MNRRLRNPSSAAPKLDHRFLRPGALARLRDSKISARSPRSAPKGGPPIRLVSPPSSPPAAPTLTLIDGSPCFAARTCGGPRLLHRKKLVAAKRIFFAPASPVRIEAAAESGLDLLGIDLVIAH